MSRRVAILGVGALGCLLGSRLAKVARVTLVGSWKEQLDRLRERRLEVEELDGTVTHHRIETTADATTAGPADLVLVVVKSHATAKAARQAQGILAPEGLVLTLQNGLGNREVLAQTLGWERVALGVTVMGANVVGPGRIRHAGDGATHLARRCPIDGKLEEIGDLFRHAGLTTHLVDDALRLLWGKLAVNAAINPLTALLGVSNGHLDSDAVARRVMLRAAREVVAVAAAQGIELGDAGEKALAVCHGTAENRSSMLQDLDRGAATEIDVVSGAVARHARQYDVPAPVNEALWRRVRERQGNPVEEPWMFLGGPGVLEEIRAMERVLGVGKRATTRVAPTRGSGS